MHTIEQLLEQKNTDELLQRINGPDDFPVMEAIRALGKLGDKKVIEPLLNVLMQDGRLLDVRMEAARTLEQLCLLQDVESLLAPALEDANTDFYWLAASLLAKLGSEKALSCLENGLEHSNGNIRKFSATTLGEIGNSHSVRPLCALLLREKNYEIRLPVVKALEKINHEEAVPALCTVLLEVEDSYDYSMAFLGDRLRLPIVRALEKFNHIDALETLIKAWQNERNITRQLVRRKADEIKRTIMDVREEDAAPDSVEVVRVIIRALEKLGPPAVAPLTRIFTERMPGHLVMGSEAQGILLRMRSAGVLETMLTGDEPAFRQSAASALEKLADWEKQRATVSNVKEGGEPWNEWGNDW